MTPDLEAMYAEMTAIGDKLEELGLDYRFDEDSTPDEIIVSVWREEK